MGALRDDLRKPAAYPPPRPGMVAIEETHISWVFLDGQHAWKVKKPVDYGFLDFRTLEQRRRACLAELALNRRLAPGIYLGVEPVRLKDGEHRLFGDGEVVDYAVKMVELPRRLRMDELLDGGLIGASDLDELAQRLVRFHAASRADAETAAFGAPEVIRRNVDENFAQLPAEVMRAEVEELRDAQLVFLARNEALLRARMDGGHVRDGHGDLRIEHVYFLDDGSVAVLDGIEFNARFRFADVCADIAFLSMELAWRDRVDLAEQFLARYALHANDYDLFPLVDFYEAYRACVRAKIAGFVAASDDTPDIRRREALNELRRFLLVGVASARPSAVPPMVIAVGGLMASGKTTVAEWLGSYLSAPVVQSDRTRKWMLDVPALQPVHDGAWSGAYGRTFTDRVYAEVLRRAEVVLSSGRTVIVDASFQRQALRGTVRALARRMGAPFLLVETRAPREVCLARLENRARGPSESDGRAELFDAFAQRFEPITELSPSEHFPVDTARRPEQIFEQLKARLAGSPPLHAAHG